MAPFSLISNSSSDECLESFLGYVRKKNLDLYPAQEDAILALYSGMNVILNTPTGSGKSLVAAALHFLSWNQGKRSYYTCPIKALVNEKFISLCKDFGPENVGMVTGDASINAKAPIICCTAEILSNLALREGRHADVQDVIVDEFHYYSDKERGVAWQIPLLTLPQARFLLMSATLGEIDFFQKALTRLNGKETEVVKSSKRPVPLQFSYNETPLHELIPDLMRNHKFPIYLVNFRQRECAEEAQRFLSIDFCTKEEKKKIAESLVGFRFSSPYGKELNRVLRHGIGIHHAGLLPKYRVLVEQLAQKGLLKLICGTDTLGVGVNVPIRSVVFSKLCKFDGQKTAHLSIRDFQQIAGRAGRKGFDNEGFVYVQAPEHVIENQRAEQKAQGDPKKLKKLVKKKPPVRGFIPWNREIYDRFLTSSPEALVSRFYINHGMILNVLSRGQGGCEAMRTMIRHSHETEVSKQRHRHQAFQIFRTLLDRKVIEWGAEKHSVKLNIDLQQDFSLNQALSIYLLDALKLLDIFSESYALDVLTLVESILEDPDQILRKQVDKLRNIKFADLKQSGVPFEERSEELENIEYPKPNRDFIYTTFNAFASSHPWVATENIKPKSIAREMFEKFFSFAEYIQEYGLQRSEGVLLRYLSNTYKVLVQNVPDLVKNDAIYDLEAYFSELIRQVDSSLLDEWEKMKNPDYVKREVAGESVEKIKDITQDEKSFAILIRNAISFFIKSLAAKDYETALSLVDAHALKSEHIWTPDRLESSMTPFYSEPRFILTDQEARRNFLTQIVPPLSKALQSVFHTVADSEGHNDWVLEFSVDLIKSRQESRVCLHLENVGVS